MTINSEELRLQVFEHLEILGIIFDDEGQITLPEMTKEFVKKLHEPATKAELAKAHKWISSNLRHYHSFFANGRDVKVCEIKPKLILVTEAWQNDLWRLARYTWFLPYSQGYGRRMRYLVMDESNDKLIGIFALQSPPIGFPARDRLFTYQSGQEKTALVNQTMDLHTLGAIMPYSRLLGGKLIALAAASNEVRSDYREKYQDRVTEIEGRQLPAELVALTTTSAFGRSSLYNRLKYKGEWIAKSLGYTEGYGHFHLEELYPFFNQYLEEQGVCVKHGYGTGPRRKWQIIRTALHRLGIRADLLKHGIKREAFIFPLIHNLDSYMNQEAIEIEQRELPFLELAAFWRDERLFPRAEKFCDWQDWEKEYYFNRLLNSNCNQEE